MMKDNISRSSANLKFSRTIQKDYCADYKMDVVKAEAQRILWMHKDENE